MQFSSSETLPTTVSGGPLALPVKEASSVRFSYCEGRQGASRSRSRSREAGSGGSWLRFRLGEL